MKKLYVTITLTLLLNTFLITTVSAFDYKKIPLTVGATITGTSTLITGVFATKGILDLCKIALAPNSRKYCAQHNFLLPQIMVFTAVSALVALSSGIATQRLLTAWYKK